VVILVSTTWNHHRLTPRANGATKPPITLCLSRSKTPPKWKGCQSRSGARNCGARLGRIARHRRAHSLEGKTVLAHVLFYRHLLDTTSHNPTAQEEHLDFGAQSVSAGYAAVQFHSIIASRSSPFPSNPVCGGQIQSPFPPSAPFRSGFTHALSDLFLNSGHQHQPQPDEICQGLMVREIMMISSSSSTVVGLFSSLVYLFSYKQLLRSTREGIEFQPPFSVLSLRVPAAPGLFLSLLCLVIAIREFPPNEPPRQHLDSCPCRSLSFSDIHLRLHGRARAHQLRFTAFYRQPPVSY